MVGSNGGRYAHPKVWPVQGNAIHYGLYASFGPLSRFESSRPALQIKKGQTTICSL